MFLPAKIIMRVVNYLTRPRGRVKSRVGAKSANWLAGWLGSCVVNPVSNFPRHTVRHNPGTRLRLLIPRAVQKVYHIQLHMQMWSAGVFELSYLLLSERLGLGVWIIRLLEYQNNSLVNVKEWMN